MIMLISLFERMFQCTHFTNQSSHHHWLWNNVVGNDLRKTTKSCIQLFPVIFWDFLSNRWQTYSVFLHWNNLSHPEISPNFEHEYQLECPEKTWVSNKTKYFNEVNKLTSIKLKAYCNVNKAILCPTPLIIRNSSTVARTWFLNWKYIW